MTLGIAIRGRRVTAGNRRHDLPGRSTAVLVTALTLMSSILRAQTAAGANTTDTKPQRGRPNFILCMTDDQGWGDTGYNGHPVLKTPVLDEMASSGLRFHRFYAAAPLCSPTRGSVMTGRHPNRYGCFSANFCIRPEEVTIAEALKAAGYATGHFGKWHLGPVKADTPINPLNSGFDETFSHDNWFDLNPQLCRNGGPPQTIEGESSEIVMDAALAFIRKKVDSKRPFLAVIWFPSPHEPCKAANKYKEAYKHLAEEEQDYYGEIAAVDAALGKLRKTLRELKVGDNTLLWFSSDNGPIPPGSPGGLRDKKGTLWEGGVRVPGIIEWPARIKKPFTTDVPCCTTDIYPTVLDIVGIKVPQQPSPIDGISLLPLFDGKMHTRPKPIGLWKYPGGRDRANGLYLGQEAQEGTWRFFRNYKHPEPKRPLGEAALVDNRHKLHKLYRNKQYVFELYDLVDDPGETQDIADRKPETTERMKAALDAWQRSVERSLTGRDY
jgi:arylsulfatase A-like enzyme